MQERIRASVRRLKAYVPGEQPRDPRIVKLNTNENPYPPSPRVKEALQGLDEDRLRRYPDPVSTALRERLADVYGRRPEEVFVGNGSDEVLALCTRAFVGNEDSVGYFEPSYSLYPVLADIREAGKVPTPLGPDYTWVPPRSDACSLFLLSHPNAPTGMVYPKETIREFAQTFRGVLVIDEAYAEFSEWDCMDLAGNPCNVIVARTLSKSFSLAGLRVGYAVGAPEAIEALFKIKDSYNLDAVSQAVALAALEDLEWMRGNVARIRVERRRLAEGLHAMGHHVYPSQTNFLWVLPTGIAAGELFDRLRERHILVRYFPGERTGDCVRITIGTDREIDALLDAMTEIQG